MIDSGFNNLLLYLSIKTFFEKHFKKFKNLSASKLFGLFSPLWQKIGRHWDEGKKIQHLSRPWWNTKWVKSLDLFQGFFDLTVILLSSWSLYCIGKWRSVVKRNKCKVDMKKTQVVVTRISQNWTLYSVVNHLISKYKNSHFLPEWCSPNQHFSLRTVADCYLCV